MASEISSEIEFYLGAEPKDRRSIGNKPPPIKPIFNVQFTQQLFARTFRPAEYLKTLIIPKKSVRFAETSTGLGSPNTPTRSKLRRVENQRFSPYSTDVRRSNRIARRRTRSMSIS